MFYKLYFRNYFTPLFSRRWDNTGSQKSIGVNVDVTSLSICHSELLSFWIALIPKGQENWLPEATIFMCESKDASQIISPHYSVRGGTIQGHKNPLGSMLTWPHFQYTKADTDYKECYCTFHVSVSLPGFPVNPLRIILKKLPLNFFGPHKYKVLCRYVTFFLQLSFPCWTFYLMFM